MRSATAPELAVLAATTRAVTQRVKVANGSGTLIDLTTWVEEVTHNVDLDRPVSALTIHFRRDSGTILSLSPLRTDSTLNRLDDGTTYSPQIAGGRRVTWEVATTAVGAAIVGGDYKLLFDGYTDEDDSGNSPLTVECRDKGGVIVDRGIEVEAGYGSLAGVAVETVMQQILDAGFGSGFIPMDVIGSPSFLVSNPSHPSGQYIQQRQSHMDAMQALAQLPAWDVRYWYDTPSVAFEFRFQQPPRTKTTPDHTLGPNAYHHIARLGLSRKDIRNVIGLEYFDAIANGRLTVTVSDAPSIAKYGRRYFFLKEADDSPINTNAEATAMANGILSDLKEPKAEAEIEMPFFWPAELWDLYRFSANGVHINTDQDWAVASLTHKLARGRHRTILTVRGAPAGGYLTWLDRPEIAGGEHRPGEVGPEAKIEVFGSPSGNQWPVLYTGIGGTAPLTYQRRIDVDNAAAGTYSAPAALGSGVSEWITVQPYYATRIFLRVIDATGLQGNSDPFFLQGELPATDKTTGQVKGGDIIALSIQTGAFAALSVTTAKIADAAVTKTKTEARFRCKVYNSVDWATTNSTNKKLDFDSEVFDVGTLHDTATNNTRITIPTGGDVGIWLFTVYVRWAPNVTGPRTAHILKNNALWSPDSTVEAVSGGSDTTHILTVYENNPTVGDYYEIEVNQISGGNLNVVGTDTFGSSFSAVHLW